MNTKLIDSLIQIIQSLNPQERALLEKKLFFHPSEPTTIEIKQLAQQGGAYDFLY